MMESATSVSGQHRYSLAESIVEQIIFRRSETPRESVSDQCGASTSDNKLTSLDTDNDGDQLSSLNTSINHSLVSSGRPEEYSWEKAPNANADHPTKCNPFDAKKESLQNTCLTEQDNDEFPELESPSSPVEYPTVSQAAYQILENILPQQLMDNISKPNSRGDGSQASSPVEAQCHATSHRSDNEHGGDAQPPSKTQHFTYLVSISRKLVVPDVNTGGLIEEPGDKAPTSNEVEKVLHVLRKELKRRRIYSKDCCTVNKSDKDAYSTRKYMLPEDDIRTIIRAAIFTLKDSNHPVSNVPKNQSLEQRKRPSLLRTAASKIQPTPASPADTATSINMPRTSYAITDPNSMQTRTKTRETEVSSTTTLVSRKSVAQITWAPETLPGVTDSNKEVLIDPLEQTAGITTVTVTKSGNVQAHETTGAMYSSSPFIIERVGAEKGTGKRCENSMLSNDEDEHITSFPELRSRHCTNEWLNPPPEIKKVVEVTDDDLYLQGVDAHCGNPSRMSIIVVEGDPPKPRHCDHNLFGENPFCKESDCSVEPPEAESPRLSMAEKRLGASIGASSHRRRSSQVAMVQQNAVVQDPDNLLPGLIDKIRRGGRKIFTKHRSHKSSDQRSGECATPYNSPDEQHQRSAIRSRDSIVRERTPEPASIDHAGIYEALTGSRLVVPRRRRDTCSEDNRPHVCEDDDMSARSPETPLSPN